MKVAVLGLGTMGTPIAHVLTRGGVQTVGYDVDDGARRRFADGGGSAAPTAQHAVDGADVVVTMLPEGRHVREALFGPSGVAASLPSGTLVIEMSTIDPPTSDEIRAGLADLGIAMVDAPVGRTSDHAWRGELVVMAGGEPDDIRRAQPLFDLMGESTVDCGGPGMGIRMKIVNNHMSTALNALSAEALALAEASGLDVDLTLEVLAGTPAGKGHFATTYPAKVLAGDLTPAFMLRLARKDLAIGTAFAARLGTDASLGVAALTRYDAALAHGRGDEDWTALYAEARRRLATGDA